MYGNKDRDDHDHCQKCTFGYTCDSCKEWQISCGMRDPEEGSQDKYNSYSRSYEYDDSCPVCGSEMILKNRRDGTAQFLGCSKFPECKGSRNYE